MLECARDVGLTRIRRYAGSMPPDDATYATVQAGYTRGYVYPQGCVLCAVSPSGG